jgi:radical SAM superfamily enzyme YgiQ (UPF0313 family)
MDFQSGLMIRTLDEEVINALCDAGGIRFSLAVESGSDYIRNTILRKNCSKEKITSVVNLLKSRGVIVNAFFIIGFPEETEESLSETLEFMDNLNIDFPALNILRPTLGTDLFEQCYQDRLFTYEFDKSRLWTGEHETLHSQYGDMGFFIKPYKLTMEKLIEYDVKMNNVVKKKMRNWAIAKMRSKNN